MLSSTAIADIAREIKDAQDRAASLAPFSGRVPGFDVPSAYAVARRVCDARRAEGFATVGRKIGFTNTSLWEPYGVHEPIWGTLYDRTVVRLDGGEGRCSLLALAEPQIEPEIAFGLRAAPESSDPSALLRSIEWVAHGFEIVQSHFPGWKFKAPDTVADNGLHGRLFLGPRRALAALGENPAESLRSFSVVLSRNAAAVETGKGSNVLGSPLAALGHLVAVLAKQPESEKLKAGDIVTTGTLTAAYRVEAGQAWRTELRGIPLPGLSVVFSA
jgi:2-oxo-3-hexenedioate decarboxylase